MKTSDVTKEYLKALVLTNKIDSANLESLSNGMKRDCFAHCFAAN